MNGFNDITSLLFYLAPLLIAMGGVYLLVKKMFDRDYKIKLIESKRMLQKEILPLRLQAYERVTLLLERISPSNLLIRVMHPEMSARQLQSELINTIRTEFDHNLSQQVYISPQAWLLMRNAKEDIVKTINLAAGQCEPDSKAIDLSNKIFEVMLRSEDVSVQKAIDFIKAEVSQFY